MGAGGAILAISHSFLKWRTRWRQVGGRASGKLSPAKWKAWGHTGHSIALMRSMPHNPCGGGEGSHCRHLSIPAGKCWMQRRLPVCVCVGGGGVGTPGPAGSWKLRSAAIGTGAAGAPADALGPQAELRVVPCPSGLKSRSTREREAPPVDGAWAPRSHPPGGGGVRRAAACVIVWYSCTLTLTLPALGS